MKQKFDLASIIGFGGALLTLLVFMNASGNSLKIILSLPPMLFIVLGSFAVTMVGFSLKDCRMLYSIISEAFIQPVDRHEEIAVIFAEAAQRMRHEGPLSVDTMLPSIRNNTIRNGLAMIVDGTSPRAVREFVEKDAERQLYPYEMGINFFRKMGGSSPTLGIVGTVVGLMSALADFSRAGHIQGSIAQAFMATLWGVAFANGVCFPLANKLEYRKRFQERELEMIFHGLIAVERGASKRLVQEKMASLLPTPVSPQPAPAKKVKYTSPLKSFLINWGVKPQDLVR